jgi:hypothetical protein
MKRLLPFVLAASLPLASIAQTVLIDESFDLYTDGAWVAQTVGLPWSTWNNQAGGIHDTQLSSEQANTGTLSMKLQASAVAGGPSDIMLRLGNRNTGVYGVSWNMYIPAGFGGYFNVQHFEVIGAGSWGFDATFRVNGAIEFSDNAAPTAMQFPHDQWFQVQLVYDLNSMVGTMWVQGVEVTTWSTLVNATNGTGINQLGGINFYAYGGGTDLGKYYVDDVLFVQNFSVGMNEVSDRLPMVYPNPATDVLYMEIGNASVITLRDLSGRIVLQQPVTPVSGGGIATIPVGHLPAGPYVLSADGDGVRSVHKILKE